MIRLFRARALPAILVIAALLLISDAPGQSLGAPQSSSPSSSPASPQPGGQSGQQTPPQSPPETGGEPSTTFKVNVNVVNLYFSVKDHKGMLVPNLTQNDFEVLEDNKPQTIKFFKSETNQPLTLGILIDTSPSQGRVLPMEQQTGAMFLRQVLTSKDLAFVIGFDVNVDLLADLTTSTNDLNDALRRTHIGGGGGGLTPGPVPTGRNAGGTHLYDAVYLAAHDVLGKEIGRKAMILLTDGQDQGSQLKIMDAIEAAQKADTICYVILIADRGFYGGYGMGYSGDSQMRKLAEATGGRMIEVGNDEKKLHEAFDQLAAELRSQYNIGYTPSNSTLDGSFRKVQVKTKGEGYKVQARAGYYAIAKR